MATIVVSVLNVIITSCNCCCKTIINQTNYASRIFFFVAKSIVATISVTNNSILFDIYQGEQCKQSI